MWDILSFNTFVTQDVSIFFYYIGAVIIPIVLWFSKDYLIEHVSLIKKMHEKIKNFYPSLNSKERTLAWLSFLTIFICFEICWRMMFEMIIGYFDMHDYLYQIMRQGR